LPISFMMRPSPFLNFFGFVLIVCAVSVLAYLSVGHFFRKGRLPAAIRQTQVNDISGLKGEELRFSIGHKLVKDMRTVEEKGRAGIELSHFLLTDTLGKVDFLCNVYESVELVFEAEGVSVNGEAPRMRLISPCEASHDPKHMQVIWVPFERFIKEKPQNSHFEVDQSTFEFKNMADIWPEIWILSEIKIEHQDEKRSLVIPKSEVETFSAERRQMSWR
jgi:hypothetical protein